MQAHFSSIQPLWSEIINKNKTGNNYHLSDKKKNYRNREGEVLFIDLRRLGSEFEKKYIELLNLKHKKTLTQIKQGKLTDEITSTLEKVASELTASYEQFNG